MSCVLKKVWYLYYLIRFKNGEHARKTQEMSLVDKSQGSSAHSQEIIHSGMHGILNFMYNTNIMY